MLRAGAMQVALAGRHVHRNVASLRFALTSRKVELPHATTTSPGAVISYLPSFAAGTTADAALCPPGARTCTSGWYCELLP